MPSRPPSDSERGRTVNKTYTNPVGNITGIGDPYVLRHEGRYYLYATSSPRGFKVWESIDLVDWELRGMALDAEDEPNRWGIEAFWAPEVIHYRDAFYMVFSARTAQGSLKLALAKSDSPLGPFRTVKVPLVERELSYIDGHFFIDDDGTPYLFYVKDCSENVIDGVHTSEIYVQPMSDDLTELLGEPVLAVRPDQPWEGIDKDWRWNEGPFVLKVDGIYYLMYSANVFSSPEYAVGYATAPSPLGPWTKAAENPILAQRPEIGVSGPGHNSVTLSPDGTELFIVYHTHTDPKRPSGNRTVNIDRLYVKDGRMWVDGPTRTPQPAPSAGHI